MLEQFRKAVPKVYIDDETSKKIVERWETFIQESSKASISPSCEINEQLTACDEKMERLLDLYISREIGPEEYQRKKGKLLNEKQAMKEKLEEIEKGGGGGSNRREPFYLFAIMPILSPGKKIRPPRKLF